MRIKNILNFKEPKKLVSGLLVVSVVGVGILSFATNRINKRNEYLYTQQLINNSRNIIRDYDYNKSVNNNMAPIYNDTNERCDDYGYYVNGYCENNGYFYENGRGCYNDGRCHNNENRYYDSQGYDRQYREYYYENDYQNNKYSRHRGGHCHNNRQ